MMRSLSAMKDTGTRSERLAALVAATSELQQTNRPVHTWEPAPAPGPAAWRQSFERVEQYMATHLFTVNEDELVDLVAFLMEKKQIRHVLVEDSEHNLVGVVSYRSVLRLVAESGPAAGNVPVKRVMEREPVTVEPDTTTLEAIEAMRSCGVSALPVVKDGKLVGIVSERDFMSIAYQLLEERLRDS